MVKMAGRMGIRPRLSWSHRRRQPLITIRCLGRHGLHLLSDAAHRLRKIMGDIYTYRRGSQLPLRSDLRESQSMLRPRVSCRRPFSRSRWLLATTLWFLRRTPSPRLLPRDARPQASASPTRSPHPTPYPPRIRWATDHSTRCPPTFPRHPRLWLSRVLHLPA
jgi:hypothetical protein